MKVHISWFGVLVVLSLAAFWFGARVGVNQSWLLSGSPDAHLTVTRLNMLRGGKADELAMLLEMQLSEQIARYGEFLDSGKPMVLWPDSHDFPHARFFEKVREYRLDNPVSPGLLISSWGQDAYDRAMQIPAT